MTSATDNRTTDLLPCPFCGGEAHIRKYCDECSVEINFKCQHDKTPNAICSLGEKMFWIEHDCAGIDGENWGTIGTDCYASAHEAIAAWNSRAERTCEIVYKGDLWWECKSCGEQMRTIKNNPNYCPNCGAKVVG